MTKFRTWIYCIGQGIKGIFKNRVYSLASITTITACLILLGAFFFVAKNLENVLDSAENSVGVTVFFEDGTGEERILEVSEEIKKRTEVVKVDYISAEEAWEKFKTESLTEDLAAVYKDDNPLEDSASLEVYMNDASMQAALVRYIKNIPTVRKVTYSDSLAEGFVGVKNIVWAICVGLIVALFAVAIFLIKTTITTGINVRKNEISIMSVIGATDMFIASPFMVEGIIIGAIGGILPIAILGLSYDRISKSVIEQFGSVLSKLTLLPGNELINSFMPISLAVGIGLGFIVSCVTSVRQIRKISSLHF